MSDHLRLYLLGTEAHARPGAIDRVKAKLEEMGSGWRPAGWDEFLSPSSAYQGSIIGARSANAIDAEGIFELAVSLVAWLGENRPHPKAARGLVSYLRTNHISDVAYLVGFTRAEHYERGKLDVVRDRVRSLLDEDESDPRCEALREILGAFLGACEHDFQPMASEDPTINVYVCACGARYGLRDGSDEWLAV